MELLNAPLADYLRHRLGPETVLERAERFPRGSSRLTWFVDYRAAAGAPVRSLVFRGDHAGGPTIHSSLEQEYFMYHRLGDTAVPVARPLWWEEDPAWVPRPFYVREQVEGSWDLPCFRNADPAFDAERIAISKEHLRKLAIVHTVDWRAHGFDERLPPPPDRATAAGHFLDRMVTQLDEYRREPLPIMVEALATLRLNPPVAPRISLCKGTNGLGEEVFRDGVIVAMSDWEEASIGDPAADFASLQDLIPEIVRDGQAVWGMEQALAYYREVSGIPLDIANVRYYQSLRMLGTLLYGHKAAVAVAQGGADIRKVWTGTEVLHLGKRMLAGMVGLPVHTPPQWFAELNETVQ